MASYVSTMVLIALHANTLYELLFAAFFCVLIKIKFISWNRGLNYLDNHEIDNIRSGLATLCTD